MKLLKLIPVVTATLVGVGSFGFLSEASAQDLKNFDSSSTEFLVSCGGGGGGGGYAKKMKMKAVKAKLKALMEAKKAEESKNRK